MFQSEWNQWVAIPFSGIGKVWGVARSCFSVLCRDVEAAIRA
jgi:hypothetical protein